MSTPKQLGYIAPMQPRLVDNPPAGDNWLREVKWDGLPTQDAIADGKATLYTRRGHHWTYKYWRLSRLPGLCPARSAVIDSEMIVADENGRSSFRELRSASSNQHRPPRIACVPVALFNKGGAYVGSLPSASRSRRAAVAKIRFSIKRNEERSVVYWG